MKRFLSLLLAAVMLLSCTAAAVSRTEVTAAVNKTAAYLQGTVKKPVVASIGGEWAVLGLARSGYAVDSQYWKDYYAAAEKAVSNCKGVLHTKKYTEYSRVILAMTAIGADPKNVAGYDLLKPLGDFEKTVWQGVNGPAWALIALDAGNYDMPKNPSAAKQATRQMYVDEILARQLSCGGWNLTDKGGSGAADADVTGMVLQALSNYQGQSKVKKATEKAIACLSGMQDAEGGFAANCESVVQVIVALCALGIPVEDSRFVKNGKSLLDALMAFGMKDGSFRHRGADTQSNLMATEQAFYALVAVKRQMEGKSSLYRMNDVTLSVGKNASNGLAGKHKDVEKVPVSVQNTEFSDTKGHKNEAAVKALASRGIISGMGDGTFAPNATVTRGQFAAIVVRSLGLTPKTVSKFSDVKKSDWFAPFVGTAYTYGIIAGKTATKFDPNGTITRQEAAVMAARAAKLCGMDTARTEREILNTLAQFGDYITAANWAKESLAFCYSENILDQRDLDICPGQAILRCEIAQMLYNMLGRANLL